MTEQMKPSGIAWMGDIPESWQIGRIKDYYVLQTGFTPDTTMPEYYDDENGAYWVSISDIDNSRSIKDTKAKISQYYIAEKHPELSPAGSLLYSFKLSVGKVAFLDKDMYTNEAIASFIDTNNTHLPFLYYSAMFIEENANTNIYGAKILNQDLIKNSYTIFPPLSEQKIIAAFLDTQCAKIDSIISDIEKQIETLQKYKKSLITETVTKGLDKSVPMKDSGIDWIGNIPEHWQIKKLSYECERIGDIDHYMPDSVDEGIPYVMTGDLIGDGNGIDFKNCKQISEQDYQRLSRKMKPILNDIIFARYATIGTVRLVDFDREFLVSYSCAIVRPKKSLHSKYLFYYLKSNAFYEEISKYINTNTQGNVGIDSLGRAKTPIPRIEEQIEISKFLDKKCADIDDVILTKNKQLDTIKQHKKSLIYEYVTGKKRVTEVN